jgi:protein arginine N-methyltransferase 1
LADPLKIARFAAAIEEIVRPDHVVMDLGCGSGLLGLMALRAGAAKVLFVEEGAIIEVARRTVAEAGFSGRAEFYRRNSFELALPEPVDIVLCDHVGYFGFDYGVIALLADARERFLRPGGIVIPAEVDVWLAAVETEAGRKVVSRWHDGSAPEDFAWLSQPAANSKRALDVTAEDLLGDPASLATLQLGADAPPFLSWQADFTCARNGTLDGLLGWFDCRLLGDIAMTNSPLAAGKIDRPQAFLPLEQPVSVQQGEPIHASVMARHRDHVLAWSINLPDQDKQYSLTTFNGLLLDDLTLDRNRPDRVARLNERGRARQVILSYCDGKRSVAEIEALMQRDHPQLFSSVAAAEKLIRHVLARDTSK